jgi:anthranilate phosphoribosyltransferase
MSFLQFVQRVSSSENLSAEDAHCAMSTLLEGGASEALIAGFLVALKMKGETAAELAGFARAMREHMICVEAGDHVIDTAGTGGDESGTFNISTAAALVMAGAGARVAKHGNRSISSRSGSADVLEALGVRIPLAPEHAARAVREIGIGFLFAPALHPAMKHVQPVRRELKMRTVFNMLGPLANPARARAQLIGSPSPGVAALMAEALAELGTGRSFVVHGRDGLDEISTTAATDVYEICGHSLEKHVWTPEHFGVPRASLAALAGGDPEHNAGIIRAVLEGARGPARDIVLVNASAGLMAGGLAEDLPAAMVLAERAIDSGAATGKLAALKSFLC